MEANWAEEGQFPWQVSIKAESSPNKGPFFCSGAVIANLWVLTSATCISRASRFEVRRGSVLHYTGGRVYTSYEAYIHPFFNATSNQNNVALIYIPNIFATADETLEFFPSNRRYPNLVGNTTLVVGWGRSDNLQQVSPLLQFAYGKVVPNSACAYNLNGSGDNSEGTLCVGFRGQRGCAGDTGSPLAAQVNRVWYLVGVAAFDAGLNICKQSNTLFTPLYTFRQWVSNVTQIPLM